MKSKVHSDEVLEVRNKVLEAGVKIIFIIQLQRARRTHVPYPRILENAGFKSDQLGHLAEEICMCHVFKLLCGYFNC
jgi:hypothetical protein